MEQFKEQLKQNYAKLKDLYLSMTLGNRIVATLLAATLFISLGYLIVGSIPQTEVGSRTVLIHNGERFDQTQQRAANNALALAGLRGHQWVGDQLQVPRDREGQFIAALAEANVFARTRTARQETADQFSPFHHAKIMNERMTSATERSAADAIRWLPGIASATVISHRRPEWERNVWARRQVVSVSVTLDTIDNRPLPDDTIVAVGNIIAPAFGITDMREIRIVDTRNSRSYNGAGDIIGSTQGEYVRHRDREQERWNRRIYEMLPPIDGLRVETTVALTTFRESRSFNIQHDRPTILTQHEHDYEFIREGWDRFFRPGQVAQWGSPLIDPTGNFGPQDRTEERRRELEFTHALPGTETTEESLPFRPEFVTVSITIPRDHVFDVWRERNRRFGDPDAQPTPEELLALEDEIGLTHRRSIAPLLMRYRENSRQNPMELVTVTFIDIPRPPEVELTAWEMFVAFLKEHWQNLALMSLVFSGLTVLWLISKPQKPDIISIYEGLETPLEAIDARIAEKIRREEEARRQAEEEEAELEAFENSLGELGSLRSLRDEIAELIAKNPEAAAAVIRQWIGTSVLVESKN